MSFFPSWSDMFDPGDTVCLNRANASPQVKKIDGVVDDLTKNWNPTGYYSAADILRVIDLLDNELVASGVAITGAPSSTGDSATVKALAISDGKRLVRDGAEPYRAAAVAAQASGAAVNAPRFKHYCLMSLNAISQVYVTATVLQCRQTWLEKWLDRAYQVVVFIGNVLAKIGGIIVAAGQAVLDAAAAGVGAVKTLVKILPYIAVGLVIWVGYSWIRRAHEIGPSATYARIKDVVGGRAKRRAALPAWSDATPAQRAAGGVQGVEKTLTPTQTRTLKIIKARGSEGRYLYTREKGYNLQAAHALLKMGVIRIVGSVTIDGVDMPRVSAI